MVLRRRRLGLGRLHPTALWVVPVAELGGVARHVLDVAEVGLPAWRLVVICPEGALGARLRELGAAVATAQIGPEAGLLASVRVLRRAIVALRPDVVHSHLAFADIVAALATLGLPTCLATTEHGIALDDAVYHRTRWQARLMAYVHRTRLATTDIAIAVSHATRQAMLEKWATAIDVAVVPNGVDADVERGFPPTLRRTRGKGPRVLSLARLSREKRLLDLLTAFAHLRRTCPEATLTLAGEGPERHAVEAAVRDMGLENAVLLPGFVDPVHAMADADVVVQLSVWENCSYTLLDAMAAGLGVVATPVGGNPEILPAQCLAPADEPGSVAAAITQQAHDDARPRLPVGWPTRRDMTALIVREYERGLAT